MKKTKKVYINAMLIFACFVISSCSKHVLVPINHINTLNSTCGDIGIGKVVCHNLLKAYECFKSESYTIHPEGNTIRTKILTNTNSTIEIVCSATSFFRLRYKCFAVVLKGFDYYQIDSSIIEKNMTAEEVIKILGKPDYYSIDSETNSELLYDFEGLYNTINIYFLKTDGKQFISGINIGV